VKTKEFAQLLLEIPENTAELDVVVELENGEIVEIIGLSYTGDSLRILAADDYEEEDEDYEDDDTSDEETESDEEAEEGEMGMEGVQKAEEESVPDTERGSACTAEERF
jgi:hypothetical protein